jgi:superfamily II DNA or RNA helicase
MPTLRPYQLEILDASKKRFKAGVSRQLITIPTACGKTVVFVNLQKHLGISGKVLILAHREELIQQAVDKFKRWNPEAHIDVEMAERRASKNSQIIVGSVPTLGRQGSTRLGELNPAEFGLIICDESHHATADSYKTIFNHFKEQIDAKKTLLWGCTATPNRADGEGLHDVFDEIVYSMSTLDAIKQGWLSNIRGYRITTSQSLDNVHVQAGDFKVSELSNAVNNEQRNQLVVKHWLEVAKGRQTIVFCTDIAHAKSMAETFLAQGVKARAIWGDDPNREAKLNALRTGAIEVLCNCNILTEGFDLWSVGCICMARPTKSSLLFVQCIGRGLRIPDNINNLIEAEQAGIPIPKKDCILLDVVDSTTKHNLVTLPSLFGMGNKMDMKGRTITTSLDYFNKVQQDHPNADLSAAADITKLNSYATSVDLFSMNWANEILEAGSKFQWHKSVDGHYVLYLRHGRVDVYEDLLQKWNVVGKVEATTNDDIGVLRIEGDAAPNELGNIDRHGLNDLPTALHDAEDFVRNSCPEEVTLLRREARWHKDPASDGQIRLLNKFRIPIKPGLTKGEAQLAISRVLKRVPR